MFFLLCVFRICLEPHCERFDRLRAAGCQGDGVFGSEEVCAQRSRSTQLHVSHRDVQSRQQISFMLQIEDVTSQH